MQKGALVDSTTDTFKKSRLRERTDRAWFSRLYDIRPGNAEGLFLQPQTPYGAVLQNNRFGWLVYDFYSQINLLSPDQYTVKTLKGNAHSVACNCD